MKILVTGSSGLIGSEVVAYFAEKKHILYGSGTTQIEFSYTNDRGDVMRRTHRFEGIIPNMQRRYHETESVAVREELQKYMTKQSCPTCSGSRLKEEARFVLIKKKKPSITN